MDTNKTHMTDRNRKCHLDVGQNISVCAIPAQSFHVLLSGQSEVVIATAWDIHCGNNDTRAEVMTYQSHFRANQGHAQINVRDNVSVRVLGCCQCEGRALFTHPQ